MWLCHIPTLHHYDIFPPGGNMTGGNMLVGHTDDNNDGHRVALHELPGNPFTVSQCAWRLLSISIVR